MVAVIIPERFAGPLLRELVFKSSIRMEPLGVERASYLIGNQRLGIETQLGTAGTGEVGSQMHGKPVNRPEANIEKAIAGFVRIGRKLLNQAWYIRARLNARAVLTGRDVDLADQDLREDVVVVVSDFHSDLVIGLENCRDGVSAIVLQVPLLELVVTAFPNQYVAVQV